VGDLHAALGHRDEAAVRQGGEHALGLFVAFQIELRKRRATAYRGVALPCADEAQEERPDKRLLVVGDTSVGAFGEARDRAVDAAGLSVGRQCETVVVSFLPELEQRGGEQRQRTGLPFDIVDECGGELLLDLQADPGRGQLDCTAKLGGLHGSDEHVVRAELLREPRVGGEAPVVVGPESHGDDCAAVRIRGRAPDRLDERGPVGLGRARREQLLELIYREQDPLVRAQRFERFRHRIVRTRGEHAPELVHRPLARPDEHAPPALAPGQHAAGERGQQPGTQQGRLAAARRADDAEEARAHEAGDELGHEPLAAEEVVGIGGLEAGQAFERADIHARHAHRCGHG
jgi:hypothetical protein